MEKRLNKKGQDLSIGTLILIVLGIVVLVLLILGFTIGWDNLWDRINIFGGGAAIGDVIVNCRTTSDSFTYCNTFHKVDVDGNTEYVSCEDTRVEQGLEKTIDCPNTGENTPAWRIYNKCVSLNDSRILKDDTKVNNRNCISEILVEEQGPPAPN